MALMLALPTSSFGIGFPAAYARVTRVIANKWHVQVMVDVHATVDARHTNAQPVETRLHDLPLPSDAPLYPAVYDALKAMPEYEGAEDC